MVLIPTQSQYIELHNTTAEDIGIDNNENGSSPLVVVLTELDTTVVDTVGNNPATGYWAVPGTDGVS